MPFRDDRACQQDVAMVKLICPESGRQQGDKETAGCFPVETGGIHRGAELFALVGDVSGAGAFLIRTIVAAHLQPRREVGHRPFRPAQDRRSVDTMERFPYSGRHFPRSTSNRVQRHDMQIHGVQIREN